MKLSIIIPAHNEERRLPPVLEAYAEFFAAKMGEDVEILVVANGSTDGTAQVAGHIAERYPSIKVIDEPRRVGKGGAVILGAKQASGDYVGFVDADGATSADEFFRLYTVAQQSDGVIASRWMKGADVTIPQRAMRLLSSRLFNGLTRILLGLKYKDTQCGAKIFKAEAWQAILPDIGTTRFAFDVDLLFQLKRNGYAIQEEPTVWKDIEGSKVKFFNSSFDMFSAVVRMRLLYSPFRFAVRIYERMFSKMVEFLRRDELFCHASLLFLASMVANVCNMGYQKMVGQTLSKVEYTLLATFFALFAILARPLGTLATAMVHYTSLLVKEGRQGAIKRLLRKWVLIAAIPSVFISVVCIFFAREISSFFNLDRIAPVVVFALALPVLFLNPVVGGALRGLQRFGWVSVTSIVNATSRLVLATLLVLLVFPACGWALLGHVGGLYLVLVSSVIILFVLIRKEKLPVDKQPLPSFRFYLFQCFFIQFGLALLLMGDMVFVKHYLPDDGDFAYAATLGRMVMFLSAAITVAMAPKVASTGAFTKRHKGVYLRALLYTAGFTVVSLFACFVFPRQMISFFFKNADLSEHLLTLVRWMSVVMTLATLLSTNISLLLAQRRFRVASIAIVSALLYLFGVRMMHGSSLSIVYVAFAANLLGVVVTTVDILCRKTTEET